MSKPGNAVPGNADVPVGMDGKEAGGDAGAPREWYSRGYLPHRNAQHLIQSVTYRLADSLPQTKLKRLREEMERLSEKERKIESRKRIEEWLDAGMGCCALRHPEVARYVQDSFLRFHGERYYLHAWCIMPNHVHILVEPLTNLAAIVQGWKSYTARWALRKNHRLQLQIPHPNRFWMREYWDRYIRDSTHYHKTVDYIHHNPVSAGLCRSPEDWLWSSANSGSTPGNAEVLVGMDGKEAGGDAGAPRNTNEAVSDKEGTTP